MNKKSNIYNTNFLICNKDKKTKDPVIDCILLTVSKIFLGLFKSYTTRPLSKINVYDPLLA